MSRRRSFSALFMTPKYKATGEIQVARQSSDELGLDGMKGDGGVADALEDNIELQTQANILQSDTLALKVIENLDLEHTKDFQPIFNPISWMLDLVSPQGPKDPPNASLEDAPKRRRRVLKVFAGHLKVEPLAGTQLIDISYLKLKPRNLRGCYQPVDEGPCRLHLSDSIQRDE